MNENLSALRDSIELAPLTHADDELIAASGARYPIVKSIPRFVAKENYAVSFGAQ